MSTSFIFFGSDEFSIIILESLVASGYVPTICITQPDKPKGRKLTLTPTPLKEFCITHSIPVLTPEILVPEQIRSLSTTQFDFFVVASYGKIISQEILDIPLHGCLNVHPSLLPQYRGASPIETALLQDTKKTGVSIMIMDSKMDHGPLLLQKEYTFTTWPSTKKEVHDTLARLGGQLLTEAIPSYLSGTLQPIGQDHAHATFTKMIKKDDGLIELSDTNYQTYLKYLALTPWPGLFFFINKQNRQIRIKVESAHFESERGFAIDTVIPEGKNSMSFESFKNGYLI